MTLNVTVSTTPNENAMKFTLNRQAIDSGHKTYADAQAAKGSAVAEALFAIDGVRQVFLMADFITVTKAPEASWGAIEAPILKAIQVSY